MRAHGAGALPDGADDPTRVPELIVTAQGRECRRIPGAGVLVTQRAVVLIELLALPENDRIDHRLGDGNGGDEYRRTENTDHDLPHQSVSPASPRVVA